ncbi:DUF6527 family protein [Paracoccus denitrificans]|uniref:DUF6527 family protein n=1 Tax=Paracoccus denitrificans TaxID=266 RepID=UPI003365211A
MAWQRYCQCGRGDRVDLILLKEALSKMDAPVKCLASTLKPSVGRKSAHKSRFWRRGDHIHGCERF